MQGRGLRRDFQRCAESTSVFPFRTAESGLAFDDMPLSAERAEVTLFGGRRRGRDYGCLGSGRLFI